MSRIYILHALDETTEFLSVFKEHFSDDFFVIDPKQRSVSDSFLFLDKVPEEKVVVFLGHGHSTGLYTPESSSFEKEVFINSTLANKYFKNKVILLLSCNSNQFIKQINSHRYIIGFGNIISSMKELIVEREFSSGHVRKISDKDIDYFNKTYCHAVISALKKYQSGLYKYNDLPTLIEFFINQKINEILLNKEIVNKREIARLLFEFRNEMDSY